MLNSTSSVKGSSAISCKKIPNFQVPEAVLNLLTTSVDIGLSWKKISSTN